MIVGEVTANESIYIYWPRNIRNVLVADVGWQLSATIEFPLLYMCYQGVYISGTVNAYLFTSYHVRHTCQDTSRPPRSTRSMTLWIFTYIWAMACVFGKWRLWEGLQFDMGWGGEFLTTFAILSQE